MKYVLSFSILLLFLANHCVSEETSDTETPIKIKILAESTGAKYSALTMPEDTTATNTDGTATTTETTDGTVTTTDNTDASQDSDSLMVKILRVEIKRRPPKKDGHHDGEKMGDGPPPPPPMSINDGEVNACRHGDEDGKEGPPPRDDRKRPRPWETIYSADGFNPESPADSEIDAVNIYNQTVELANGVEVIPGDYDAVRITFLNDWIANFTLPNENVPEACSGMQVSNDPINDDRNIEIREKELRIKVWATTEIQEMLKEKGDFHYHFLSTLTEPINISSDASLLRLQFNTADMMSLDESEGVCLVDIETPDLTIDSE